MSTYKNDYKGRKTPKPNVKPTSATPKACGRERPVTVIRVEREERVEISLDEYTGLVASAALLKAVEHMVRIGSGETMNRLALGAVLGLYGKEQRNEDHS